MLVRRCLTLFLPPLLALVALAGIAGATAQPAAAGTVSGNVFDQFGNPLGGMLIETLDSVTAAPFASGTTSADLGDYAIEIVSPPSGQFKVRVSDPAGVFTTTYLYGSASFEAGELFGYT